MQKCVLHCLSTLVHLAITEQDNVPITSYIHLLLYLVSWNILQETFMAFWIPAIKMHLKVRILNLSPKLKKKHINIAVHSTTSYRISSLFIALKQFPTAPNTLNCKTFAEKVFHLDTQCSLLKEEKLQDYLSTYQLRLTEKHSCFLKGKIRL